MLAKVFLHHQKAVTLFAVSCFFHFCYLEDAPRQFVELLLCFFALHPVLIPEENVKIFNVQVNVRLLRAERGPNQQRTVYRLVAMFSHAGELALRVLWSSPELFSSEVLWSFPWLFL